MQERTDTDGLSPICLHADFKMFLSKNTTLPYNGIDPKTVKYETVSAPHGTPEDLRTHQDNSLLSRPEILYPCLDAGWADAELEQEQEVGS